MILVDQITQSDPGGGVHGDCARACIQTLAQRHMPRLPHPISTEGGWNSVFFEVLGNVYGLEYRYNPYRPEKDWSFLPRVIIAGGPTVRSTGPDRLPRHAVVWDRVAMRCVHDPHPSRAGLLQVTAYYWLVSRADDEGGRTP